jgi:hypothetical protein
VAGTDSIFTARLSDRQRAAFNTATPNRFAFKHADSRRNPEADWGRDVLRSIEFAIFQLNASCAEGEAPFACAGAITPGNAIVIASSVSNGGGASVRAAEQDRKGLIDASRCRSRPAARRVVGAASAHARELPPISPNPPAADRIRFEDDALIIPE